MILNSYTWRLVNSIPKTMGFVRFNLKDPSFNVPEYEMKILLKRLTDNENKIRPRIIYKIGEHVRIKGGPFNQFNGIVEDVKYDKERIRVGVLVFGRSTPIDLKF